MNQPALPSGIDLWDPWLAQADAARIEAAFAAQGARLRRIRAGAAEAFEDRAVPLTLEQGIAELERLVLRELARLTAQLADEIARARVAPASSPARALLEEEFEFARELGLDCAAEREAMERHLAAGRARSDVGSPSTNGAGALRDLARRFEALADSRRAGFASVQRSSAP